MAEEEEKDSNKAHEPSVNYGRRIRIFHSFEEQEEYEREEMAKLSSDEIMHHLRLMINTAYAMHGYDPVNLPSARKIRILGYK